MANAQVVVYAPSDRVVVLNQGRIIADGKTVEIMSNSSLMEANGLEVPHSLTHNHR